MHNGTEMTGPDWQLQQFCGQDRQGKSDCCAGQDNEGILLLLPQLQDGGIQGQEQEQEETWKMVYLMTGS